MLMMVVIFVVVVSMSNRCRNRFNLVFISGFEHKNMLCFENNFLLEILIITDMFAKCDPHLSACSAS